MAKQSLLLVDGDTKSLRVLEVSLKKAGFNVTTAENGRDGLDLVRTAQPDLIISDTEMPEMDGFAFCETLKRDADWQDIPFVFLTGQTAIEHKIRGLQLGVEDYLTKPIYIKEIVTRISLLLQKRQRSRIEARRSSRTRFSGRLSDMGVVDLIQTIDVSRKSGVIAFHNDRGESATLYFRDGAVIDAQTGNRTGEDAVFRLLVWNEGEFEVVFSEVDRHATIEMSSQGLLMEGMRRLDEWGRHLEQLPSLDQRFAVDVEELAGRLGELPDRINDVLRLFDGERSLLQVVDSSEFGDLETVELISKLYFEGLIVSADEPDEESEPISQEEWANRVGPMVAPDPEPTGKRPGDARPEQPRAQDVEPDAIAANLAPRPTIEVDQFPDTAAGSDPDLLGTKRSTQRLFAADLVDEAIEKADLAPISPETAELVQSLGGDMDDAATAVGPRNTVPGINAPLFLEDEDPVADGDGAAAPDGGELPAARLPATVAAEPGDDPSDHERTRPGPTASQMNYDEDSIDYTPIPKPEPYQEESSPTISSQGLVNATASGELGVSGSAQPDTPAIAPFEDVATDVQGSEGASKSKTSRVRMALVASEDAEEVPQAAPTTKPTEPLAPASATEDAGDRDSAAIEYLRQSHPERLSRAVAALDEIELREPRPARRHAALIGSGFGAALVAGLVVFAVGGQHDRDSALSTAVIVGADAGLAAALLDDAGMANSLVARAPSPSPTPPGALDVAPSAASPATAESSTSPPSSTARAQPQAAQTSPGPASGATPLAPSSPLTAAKAPSPPAAAPGSSSAESASRPALTRPAKVAVAPDLSGEGGQKPTAGAGPTASAKRPKTESGKAKRQPRIAAATSRRPTLRKTNNKSATRAGKVATAPVEKKALDPRANDPATATASAPPNANQSAKTMLAKAAKSLRRKRYSEALALIEQAIEKDPSGQAFTLKAEALLASGDNEAALKAADSAVRKGARNASAHLTKGWIHYELKQYPAAKRAWERYLKLKPRARNAEEIQLLIETM